MTASQNVENVTCHLHRLPDAMCPHCMANDSAPAKHFIERQQSNAPSVQSPLSGEWLSLLLAPAPEGIELDTCVFDADGMRNVQPLVRKGRLWFFPDMKMYVYYTPTHWRMP